MIDKTKMHPSDVLLAQNMMSNKGSICEVGQKPVTFDEAITLIEKEAADATKTPNVEGGQE